MNRRWMVAILALCAGAGAWAVHATWRKSAAFPVTLYRGDLVEESLTAQRTVAGLLRERGVLLGPHDVVAPPLSSSLRPGLEIDLGLVERRVETVKKRVPCPVSTEYTDCLNVGEIIDVQQGQDGLQECRTEKYLLNGEEAFQKVLSAQWITPPKEAKVIEGTSTRQKLYHLPKRARVSKTLKMNATAYYPGPEDTGQYADGLSATNMRAGYGMAAVDPKYIRMKTPLYVEGYGYAMAADVGGAIKGNHIDLCFDSYLEAVRFGRKDVKVYILR